MSDKYHFFSNIQRCPTCKGIGYVEKILYEREGIIGGMAAYEDVVEYVLCPQCNGYKFIDNSKPDEDTHETRSES